MSKSALQLNSFQQSYKRSCEISEPHNACGVRIQVLKSCFRERTPAEVLICSTSNEMHKTNIVKNGQEGCPRPRPAKYFLNTIYPKLYARKHCQVALHGDGGESSRQKDPKWTQRAYSHRFCRRQRVQGSRCGHTRSIRRAWRFIDEQALVQSANSFKLVWSQ